jgi:hypothetical protein
MKYDDSCRAPRRPLVVDLVVTDIQSGVQISERTKDLSRCGCGVTTATPFPAGTRIMLKATYREETITAFGKVAYGRPNIGMVIAFTTVAPEVQKLIEDWIAELEISNAT